MEAYSILNFPLFLVPARCVAKSYRVNRHRPIVVLAILVGLMWLVAGCGSSSSGQIVFVSEVDGDAEILILDPDTEETTPLTDNRSRDFAPNWSPDGDQVIFVSDESGDLEINLVDREGHQINRLTNSAGDDQSPRWSPGGESVAFVSNQDGNPEVYVLRPAGGRATRLTSKSTEDRLGDWSPDGVWLAFYSQGDESERGIWLRNPDGVNLVHLTTEHDSQPVWSPDGNHIAFVRHTEGNDDIFLVSKLKNGSWQDDTELTRLTQHPSADMSPAWSPDSGIIAFVSRRDDNAEIYTMRDDGSRQLRLTTNEADDLAPVWSPDGKQISFVSHLYGAGEIFVMDSDGVGQRRMTNNDAEDYSPDW